MYKVCRILQAQILQLIRRTDADTMALQNKDSACKEKSSVYIWCNACACEAGKPTKFKCRLVQVQQLSMLLHYKPIPSPAPELRGAVSVSMQ